MNITKSYIPDIKYLLMIIIISGLSAGVQNTYGKIEPIEYVYDSSKNKPLKVYVFNPIQYEEDIKYPAVVIFHGGGWVMGEASWSFKHAESYAKRGLVGIAAEYRLSDQELITPVDAIDDACNLILWVRNNAKDLNIDPDRIIAQGWSAGAHLAACTAVFPAVDKVSNVSSTPNALVLVSPAVSVVKDGWFKRLLLGKVDPEDYSPAEHIREGMPPSIIVMGKDDTVTPLFESELWHKNMLRFGNISYLHVYNDVGHLFTPSSQPDDGWPDPNDSIQTIAYAEINLFLLKLGYFD
jgi:acetyl esterase/lipase